MESHPSLWEDLQVSLRGTRLVRGFWDCVPVLFPGWKLASVRGWYPLDHGISNRNTEFFFFFSSTVFPVLRPTWAQVHEHLPSPPSVLCQAELLFQVQPQINSANIIGNLFSDKRRTRNPEVCDNCFVYQQCSWNVKTEQVIASPKFRCLAYKM